MRGGGAVGGDTRLKYHEEQRQHAALKQGRPVRRHRGGIGAEAQAPAQLVELHAGRQHAQLCTLCVVCMLVGLHGRQRVAQRRDWNDRAGAEAEG
jgi:hypothetical protein